jgi:hypothetical protein
MIQQEEQPIDVVPPEKIAFIAYNIGVYESVQKFGGLITSGNHQPTVSNNKKPTIDTVTASEVNYVMRQLKTAGIPIP